MVATQLVSETWIHPLLDTRKYECEVEDGTVMRYHENVIAENIFAQCDDAGCRQAILDEIIDHKRDERALCFDNGFVTTKTWTTDTEKYSKRMKDTLSLERWIVRLGRSQTCQGLQPDWIGWIHGGKPYPGGACIQVVGIWDTANQKSNHWKGEKSLLED